MRAPTSPPTFKISFDAFAVYYRYPFGIASDGAPVNQQYRRLVIWITDVGCLMGDLSSTMEWKPIETAPFNRDLELAVMGSSVTHVIAFPCRRLADDGWLDAETNKRVYYIRPTHWRDWSLN